MTIPDPPPQPPWQEQAATLALLSTLGLIPGGGAIQPMVEAAVAKGRNTLMQQFYEEVAHALRRHEQRIGHVEFESFVARGQTAAALNNALGIAGKTASKEKHRLLANALVNGASAPLELDPLLPLLWSLVERHSALDVQVLRFFSDPINLAVRAGYEFEKHPNMAECLFHVVPELRYGTIVEDVESGGVVLRPLGDEAADDNDGDEWLDEPEHDVSLPPDPYFLLRHSLHLLHQDQLLDIGAHGTVRDMLDFMEEAEMNMGDDSRDAHGLFPGAPFESLTELGGRYLAFLSAPDPERPEV